MRSSYEISKSHVQLDRPGDFTNLRRGALEYHRVVIILLLLVLGIWVYSDHAGYMVGVILSLYYTTIRQSYESNATIAAILFSFLFSFVFTLYAPFLYSFVVLSTYISDSNGVVQPYRVRMVEVDVNLIDALKCMYLTQTT